MKKERRVLVILLYVIAGLHAVGGVVLFLLTWKLDQQGVFKLLCLYVSIFGMVLALAVRASTLYFDLTSVLKNVDVNEIQGMKSSFDELKEMNGKLSKENEKLKNQQNNPKGIET